MSKTNRNDYSREPRPPYKVKNAYTEAVRIVLPESTSRIVARSCDHVVLFWNEIATSESTKWSLKSRAGDEFYSVVYVQAAYGGVAAKQIAEMITFAVLVSPQFDFLVTAARCKVVSALVVFYSIHFAVMAFKRIPRTAESRQNVTLALSKAAKKDSINRLRASAPAPTKHGLTER